MTILTDIIIVLVAIEFGYIFYLEIAVPDSERTAGVFGMDINELRRPAMKNAMKNQGVYNLGIGILLLLAVFAFRSKAMVISLLAYIIFVALYGSFTGNKTIILKQGGLAVIALILSIFFLH